MSSGEREKLLESSARIVRENMTWDVIGRIIEKGYLEALKKK
jgi:hypothetical protein